ncbi:uncharacterized protein [Rutidosis leptorrhynchoides]|uniref:uncharacterized protein n=1 Tax=Rutidosis leptorrhynchoides TaxID=125765 RepID=UPI003A99148E
MHWVSWNVALGALDKGGLGIGSLRASNLALMYKWIWRIALNPNAKWATIIKLIHGPATGIADLSPRQKGKVGNGRIVPFWLDEWCGNGTLASRYPRLFHLEVNPACLVAERRWKLADDGVFSVSVSRVAIDDMLLPSSATATRWFEYVPRKTNIFLWRLAIDRLPTRLKLSQKGLDIEDIGCASCHHGIEDADHVFFRCPIAIDIWRRIYIWINMDRPIPLFLSWQELILWVDNLQDASEVKKKIMVIFATSVWTIWKLRNSIIFGPSPIRKCGLFDFICDMSFNWYCNRGRKSIYLNVWLLKPL